MNRYEIDLAFYRIETARKRLEEALDYVKHCEKLMRKIVKNGSTELGRRLF